MELKPYEAAGLLIASHLRGALARSLLGRSEGLAEADLFAVANRSLDKAGIATAEATVLHRELALLDATGLVERTGPDALEFRLTAQGRWATEMAFDPVGPHPHKTHLTDG